MQPVGDAVEMSRSLTSGLLKVGAWMMIGIGALMLAVAIGSGAVALDVGGSAEWFSEHSTECGPTGGASFETCSDTHEQPDVTEVKNVFWILFGVFAFMAVTFFGVGWLMLWLGRRSRRWFDGIGAAGLTVSDGSGVGGPPSSRPSPPPGPIL